MHETCVERKSLNTDELRRKTMSGKKKEVNLEEDSFSMVALSTSNSFSARKSWICSNILQNLSPFPYSMMDLISIDTVIISNFLQTQYKRKWAIKSRSRGEETKISRNKYKSLSSSR